MNNKINSKSAILLFSMHMIYACSGPKAENQSSGQGTTIVDSSKAESVQIKPIDFIEEDSIDLEKFFKDKGAIDIEANDFKSRIAYGMACEPIDTAVQELNMQAVVELYKIARSLSKDAPTSFLTGVKIALGIGEDRKMVYYFEPVLMTFSDTDNEGKWYQVRGSQNYIIDKGKPVLADNSTLSSDTARYLDSFRIKRLRRSTSFEPFQKVTDDNNWKGDTKSITFSFQEIFTLYHNIYGKPSEGGYGRSLYINNGAARYKKNALVSFPKRYKHTLFLTGENINGEALVPVPRYGNADMAANLAHLCPPSCNVLFYPVLKRSVAKQ